MHGEGPVGEQGDVPAAVVDGVVVLRTEREQVVEVGWSVLADPVDDVVDLAVPEADGAVGEATGAVHRAQRSALCLGGDAAAAAVVEDDTGAVEHDRDDRRVAGDPAHRLGWHRLSVGRLTDAVVVGAIGQRVVVDQHRHLRRATLTGAWAGDGGDERVGAQLIERALFGLRLRPLRGDGRVQRCRHPGVGLGVQRDVGVAQPGLAVGPPAQGPLPADPFPPGQPVVGGEAAGEVTHVAFEPVHRRHLGGLHELGCLLDQLLTHLGLDLPGDPGHRVDMAGSDRSSSERFVQVWHRRAHLSARRDGVRLTRGAAPAAGDHRRVVAHGGEGGVERVEPGTDL